MDVIVVGAGLSGLVAATEAADRGKRVMIVDQEAEQSAGGQAHWSFGGLFLVDSPEQRRMKVRDSFELAMADWTNSAQWDDTDEWGKKWAREYVTFATYEKRDWLASKGVKFFPIVGWAERGDGRAAGHGNSVPRFHITWGTGPGVVEPFMKRAYEHVAAGRITLRFRHRVENLLVEGGSVVGVSGSRLTATDLPRGVRTSREVVGDFEYRAGAVIVASGGIGGNLDLVRQNWPARLGTAPKSMVIGVPAFVDGSMLEVVARVGAYLAHPDRMWHYTEGIKNFDPVWPSHGIRILPGPSSLWLDATGERLPAPCYPGFDTMSTLAELRRRGHEYSWFVLTQKIIEKEFALSGSEQNPDLTGKSIKQLLGRLGPGAPGPVEAFKTRGEDFIVAKTLPELVAGMNELTGDDLIDETRLRQVIEARDSQLTNPFTKDAQIRAIRNARNYLGDKLIRVARPHRILDEKAGPLIAVRLHILSRKTLGGIQTNLKAQALDSTGAVIDGLYAVGEAAGFGGGGIHGHNALEGTFLGGCLLTGRVAGRSV